MTNKIIIGGTLLLGIILALSVCNLFSKDSGNYLRVTKLPKAAAIQKQVTVKENLFKLQQDSLNAHAASLTSTLKQTKQQLQAASQYQQQLKAKVNSLEVQQQLSKNKKDTVTFYATADSLKDKVNELIVANDSTQKAYEAITDNLGRQLQNKDSVIAIKITENSFLNNTLAENLTSQKQLEGQLTLLTRKYKRKKLGSKLQSAALIALSVLTFKLIAK